MTCVRYYKVVGAHETNTETQGTADQGSPRGQSPGQERVCQKYQRFYSRQHKITCKAICVHLYLDWQHLVR